MRKKKLDETPEEKRIRKIKEGVASVSSRNEHISWNRKLKNMQKLIEELVPIEEKILEITREEKYPIMDKIESIRTVMVNECVHPEDYLVIHENEYIECKFCNKKIAVKYGTT